MKRDISNRGIGLYQSLGPVPVMNIPIDDQDLWSSEALPVPRRHDDIIDQTESHATAGEGMMAGGTDGRKAVTLGICCVSYCRQNCPSRAQDGRPAGAIQDRVQEEDSSTPSAHGFERRKVDVRVD
jgi:hypothetical protein